MGKKRICQECGGEIYVGRCRQCGAPVGGYVEPMPEKEEVIRAMS